jgi:hypothetical protein
MRMARGGARWLLLVVALLPGGTPAPQAQSAPSPVKSVGNFSHIVGDLDRSLAFYRDGLGLELTGPAAVFKPDAVIMKLANVLRIAVVRDPNNLFLELIQRPPQ